MVFVDRPRNKCRFCGCTISQHKWRYGRCGSAECKESSDMDIVERRLLKSLKKICDEQEEEIERLRAEVARLTKQGAELARLRLTEQQKAADEIEHANMGNKAAEHLIRAATGPEDGPTSWRDTANRWLDEFGTFTLTESPESGH